MEDSLVVEFAQLLCAGIMAAAQTISTAICMVLEMMKSTLKIIGIVMKLLLKTVATDPKKALTMIGDELQQLAIPSYDVVQRDEMPANSPWSTMIGLVMLMLMAIGVYALFSKIYSEWKKYRVAQIHPTPEQTPEELPRPAVVSEGFLPWNWNPME